ncbi:trehalose-phosphatase [Aestuariibius insulae]|uniref:trehalose-phosphatase n=1 Tax=Aestuariibius insulae TaxID=2058287 RepID=UPI00345F104C
MISDPEPVSVGPSLDLKTASVFLDFDGTLVDLADTPDGVSVPDDLPALLQDLYNALSGRLALVSGRKISDLETFLPTFPGPMAGGHGAETRIDGNYSAHPFSGSEGYDQMLASLEQIVSDHPGSLLEEKPTGAVVHYRQVPDKRETIGKALASIMERHKDLELHQAKMAFELKPSDVDKGEATLDLWKHLGGNIPVFMGDDASDEPAMDLVQKHGGFAIKVGDGDTIAHHRKPDPASIRALLRSWLTS